MAEASPSTAAERDFYLELLTAVLQAETSRSDDLVQQLERLLRQLMAQQDTSPELLLADWLHYAL